MDLSADQFPPQWTYFPQSPISRLSFREQDLLQPFPEELHGTFDVVHCKHFVSTIPAISDLTILLHQFYSLLKPGGFLQWVEPTWPTAAQVTKQDLYRLRLDVSENVYLTKTLPQAAVIDVTERLMQIATRMKFTDDFPVFLTCVPGLFEDASVDMPVIVPELIGLDTSTWMMNWEEFLITLESSSGRDSEVYKQCLASYHIDRKYVDQGGLLSYVMAIGIARKI